MTERPKSAAMRVKLKYPDVETFLAKYGPNISRGGVFIGTKAPRAVATPVRFDFVLVHEGTETSVLRGEGTVHFVREVDPATPNKPAGMGIKFTRLFDDGQALVERALRMRAPQGKEPEREATGPLPGNVREVTGEVEVVTGPVPRIEDPRNEVPPPDAAPPPDQDQTVKVPKSLATDRDLDIDALLAQSGVSEARVAAVLERGATPGLDESTLPTLLEKRSTAIPTPAEAAAALDELLARKR